MAEGIDSWGHKGCLEGGGKTIAVLGTGVDVCFPRSNGELYKRIASEGLLLSEYVPGEWGRACNFPERNRIISGLSSAVIVIEGALKSGSMITAGLAAEQGRDVYAVPGNINQPNSVGVNKLIADGAYPVFTLDGLEESLGLKAMRARKEAEALSPLEKRLLALVIENPGAGCEYLASKLDESPVMLRTLLMAMELKGLVRCESEAYFAC
ncbi:MAG: DNA-protecting protein DprA [Firmicutes bacterium]|nr:DNA-protecting protein DprA [Bacillota bacterium]